MKIVKSISRNADYFGLLITHTYLYRGYYIGLKDAKLKLIYLKTVKDKVG